MTILHATVVKVGNFVSCGFYHNPKMPPPKSNTIQNPPDVKTRDITRGINPSRIPGAHKSGRQKVQFLVKFALSRDFGSAIYSPFASVSSAKKGKNISGGLTSSGIARKDMCGLGLFLTQVL